MAGESRQPGGFTETGIGFSPHFSCSSKLPVYLPVPSQGLKKDVRFSIYYNIVEQIVDNDSEKGFICSTIIQYMSDQRLGEFEEIILLLVGILADEAYAFHIGEAYTRQTGKSSSIGAIHSTLSRLEQKGFLKSLHSDPTPVRGGRRKRIYRITALGQRALTASRQLRQSLWNQFPGFSDLSFHHE